jgi:signal transduction histidine kinase
MKKVALVFVLVVFVPSLILAWLAVRSLRDQQFLLEKQRSQLYQGTTDTLAKQVQDALAEDQHQFAQRVNLLLRDHQPRALAKSFNRLLEWPLAQVAFAVTTEGELLAPASELTPEARAFRRDNGAFIGNREQAEVYLNANSARNFGFNNYADDAQVSSSWNILSQSRSPEQSLQSQKQNDGLLQQQAKAKTYDLAKKELAKTVSETAVNETANAPAQEPRQSGSPQSSSESGASSPPAAFFNNANRLEFRNIVPQQNAQYVQNTKDIAANTLRARSQSAAPAQASSQSRIPSESDKKASELADRKKTATPNPPAGIQLPQAQTAQVTFDRDTPPQPVSRIAASPTEFRQLIGEESEGTLARFVDNKLNILFWCRPAAHPDFVFGAQLSLPRLLTDLKPLLQNLDRDLQSEICLALLDDTAKPVALSHPEYRGAWKHPFVASEVGEALPHWEVAAYLLDPARLSQSAQTLKLTLGLVIALLVVAIGVGSWLIVSDLNRQLTLARQKTDFVSNVSHELKTPLTSIRMFSELLAEGRVSDPAKQRSYLDIITAEAARLTRLINNVLDFARMERGEKKYQFQPCDLERIVQETVEAYRPHLESNGFQLLFSPAPEPLPIRGDRDALAQVLVNLLSNAEKYGDSRKEITVELARQISPLPHAVVRVLDRGLGVPRGSEERIFEQFYRAHDALNSGIQGSGLGLTLARQIARAHGGEIAYEPRDGGGSCFSLRLPVSTETLS